jgi:hypothetical protein
MPLVTIPTSTYAVTFNAAIGSYEMGDSDCFTLNYISDDIAALAAEVITSDPKFPMRFVHASADEVEFGIVGLFVEEAEETDEYPTAVMFVRSKF